MMRRCTIHFVAVTMILAAGGAAGQPPAESPAGRNIVAIEFVGADSVDRARLNALVQSRVGQPYDAIEVREDLKRLSTVAREAEARRVAEGEGVKLIFALVENPKIRDISIVGNSKITTKRLLATLPVKAGEVLEVDSISRGREKILKDYRAAGHTRTEVRIQDIEHPDGLVSLQILINEGQRLKIKEIKLVGAENLSKIRLRWKMANKGSWLFFDNFFDEAAFEEDIQSIARTYVSYGYFDARVKPARFIYNEKKREVTPVVNIEEGPRYAVGRIDVRGATQFGRAEVQEPLHDLIGEPFDSEKLAKAIARLKALYQDEGFLLTQVDEDYHFDKQAGTTDVTLKIDEGRRIRVGSVIVDRETHDVDEELGFFGRFYSKLAPPVKDETIQREVRLTPGEVYRGDLERETVRRLERLGVFDDVQVHSEPTAEEGVRDVVISVDEGITGNLVFGAGFGDASGAFVFGAYTERNLFGDARDLRARVMVGTKAISGHVGYYDRHWRADGSSLAVDLFKTGHNRRGYDENQVGTTAEVGKPVNDYVRNYMRARLGFAWFDEREEMGEDLGSYAIATGRYRIVHDNRDSNLWPTTGVARSVGLEAGFAGGPLVKLTGRYATYKSLREGLIYALRTEGGIMPFNADKVGITERFFMGGTDDLRGFAFRGAGPMDDKHQSTAIGGSTKLLVQNELRYTLLNRVGLGASGPPLRGLVFADAGILGRSPLDIGIPRASVGTGFRLDMRRINVGVDFALPVLKKSNDRAQFFHFKVSSAF
jgi:outer membrane protein insertion porin family